MPWLCCRRVSEESMSIRENIRRVEEKLRAAEETSDLIVAIEPRGRGGVYEGVMNRLTKAAKKYDG